MSAPPTVRDTKEYGEENSKGVGAEESVKVDIENDTIILHIMDLLLINEGEICSAEADAYSTNAHNVMYTIRIGVTSSGKDCIEKINNTSNKRKLRRSITWDEKFPISTSDKNVKLEINLIKNGSEEAVIGAAVVDLSIEYMNYNVSTIMVIALSNEKNQDYNGVLVKSKLRIGISRVKASHNSIISKKKKMKVIKVHSYNPIRRKNTVDYMALMADIFLISIESEKYCSANTFIEFIKTFFNQKILIDVETIVSNVISRSTHGSIAKSDCEVFMSTVDKLKWDVEKSCKFIDELFVVYFEYSASCRFISSLDKSKVIEYSDGTVTDVDINKSIIELQSSLSEYSNELKQTEDYFTEINKAIVDEKITTEAKEVATTTADEDLQDTLPNVDIVAAESKVSIVDKLCNMMACKNPDLSFTLMKTKIANVLRIAVTTTETVKPIVKNLQNITEIIGQYYTRLNRFSLPSPILTEDITLVTSNETPVTTCGKRDKAVSTLDFCTRNMVMSAILECCESLEKRIPRSNIIVSIPPRKFNDSNEKAPKTLPSTDYQAIFALSNMLHQCYKDKSNYTSPPLDDYAYYNLILKRVCDLYDGGFDPLTILITAFITKFESAESTTIVEFVNWLSNILHITDLKLSSRNITRKLLLKDEKMISQDLVFGDDEIASFLSYCQSFEENGIPSDFAELNAILDHNSFLEKMIFEDGSLMHLAVQKNLKKLTEILISRDILDLDIRDRYKRDYSWYARNNVEIQKSILTGNRNKASPTT